MEKVLEQSKTEDFTGLRHFLMNTSLFPVFDIGMYDSIFSPDSFIDDVIENEEEFEGIDKKFIVEGEMDYDAFVKHLFKASSKMLKDEVLEVLRPYGIAGFVPKQIYSPKYYNYEKDQLVFEVYLSEDFETIFHENMNRFRRNASLQMYIEDNYWDKSGFCSFMPKSFDEIEEFTDEVRCLAAYMTFAMLEEGKRYEMEEGYRMSIYQDFYESVICDSIFDFYLYGDRELLLYVGNGRKFKDGFEQLLWMVYDKLGHLWKGYQPKNLECLGRSQNDGESFLYWAMDNGYTLKSLRELVA